MNLSSYRPPVPIVHCSVCNKTPDKVSDTAIHFDFPTKYGIIFIRIECHGQKQDIAASFKWCHAHRQIEAFKYDGEDYGLRDLAELDGFHLPKEYDHCMKQLEDRQPAKNVLWKHASGEPRCSCEFPRILTPYFRECQICMKLLPEVIDPIFIRAIEREIESVKHRHNYSIDDLTLLISTAANQLIENLKRSETKPVMTGDITELCGRLAFVALKAFERFGTPKTMPTKQISTWKTQPGRQCMS